MNLLLFFLFFYFFTFLRWGFTKPRLISILWLKGSSCLSTLTPGFINLYWENRTDLKELATHNFNQDSLSGKLWVNSYNWAIFGEPGSREWNALEEVVSFVTLCPGLKVAMLTWALMHSYPLPVSCLYYWAEQYYCCLLRTFILEGRCL